MPVNVRKDTQALHERAKIHCGVSHKITVWGLSEVVLQRKWRMCMQNFQHFRFFYHALFTCRCWQCIYKAELSVTASVWRGLCQIWILIIPKKITVIKAKSLMVFQFVLVSLCAPRIRIKGIFIAVFLVCSSSIQGNGFFRLKSGSNQIQRAVNFPRHYHSTTECHEKGNNKGPWMHECVSTWRCWWWW